ncbi:MAG: FAD-binding oxidoreductase, partial [Acidobacteria bacterium]|nr:FAD-binding oxidoreductase [Acidobacteriota bacterium]
ACTVGGNIAENAGGIHCLKYGVTTDHVTAARVVLADGRTVDLGGEGESAGYDLLGVFVGSEGTFGIVTEATVRLLPTPQAVRTLLADFADVDEASRAVSAIIAAGLIPAALEMVDNATIRAVEASVFAAGLPLDAEAALLIELDGLEAGLDEEAARAEAICRERGARGVRRAVDERERKKLWAARKGAFGAMGRLAPDMMIQDAVVPRSRLPEVLAETYRVSAKYRLRLANVFHAGDGNLHPFISFDRRDRAELRRVEEAGREIMEACVRAGGTITGEHGVGLDKSAYLPLIFSPDDLEAMLSVRAAFDPSGLCNPGKIIPAPPGCGEARAVAARPAASRNGDSTPGHGGPETRPGENVIGDSRDEIESPSRPRPGDQAATQPVAHDRAALETDLSSPLPQPPDASSRTARPGFESVKRAFASVVGESNVEAREGGLTVRPASSGEAGEVIRLAAGARVRVVPEGAGLWPGETKTRAAGGDGGARVYVSTNRMCRVLAHEPADLVATVEAGVTLDGLNGQLGRANQWLPLDPPDDGRATAGGVVASGLGGAQTLGYGPPRAYVLGMRVALADGRVIKAGGRVVKNVAGYDLCKLFTGSRGTLGLITELTFRLRPRPEREATLAVRADAAGPLLEGARAVRAGEFLPAAVELLSPRAAASLPRVGTASRFTLIVRFAGTASAVGSQLERARAALAPYAGQGACEVLDDDVRLWTGLAAVPLALPYPLKWRANVRPSALPGLLAKLDSLSGLRGGALWHASLGAGRVRVLHEEVADLEDCAEALSEVRAYSRECGGALEVEGADEAVRHGLAGRGFDSRELPAANVELIGRVKHQLDPFGLFPAG